MYCLWEGTRREWVAGGSWCASGKEGDIFEVGTKYRCRGTWAMPKRPRLASARQRQRQHPARARTATFTPSLRQFFQRERLRCLLCSAPLPSGPLCSATGRGPPAMPMPAPPISCLGTTFPSGMLRAYSQSFLSCSRGTWMLERDSCSRNARAGPRQGCLFTTRDGTSHRRWSMVVLSPGLTVFLAIQKSPQRMPKLPFRGWSF